MLIPPEIEAKALWLVKINKGMSGTSLVISLGSQFLHADPYQLRRVPAELALRGELVEIEYMIPGEASQSLFLPKGTEIRK